jgi:hypothetical protein
MGTEEKRWTFPFSQLCQDVWAMRLHFRDRDGHRVLPQLSRDHLCAVFFGKVWSRARGVDEGHEKGQGLLRLNRLDQTLL